MADHVSDFEWQRRFIPQMKRVLAECLITEAPMDEDQTHNTDLVVLDVTSKRVACRVRTHDYLKYEDEFTIRSVRPSGAMTELAKVRQGWGDYIFYGFADQSESELCAWLVGDLDVFRLWHARETERLSAGETPGVRQANGDGSSQFDCFKIDRMPDGFQVARKQSDLLSEVRPPARPTAKGSAMPPLAPPPESPAA